MLNFFKNRRVDPAISGQHVKIIKPYFDADFYIKNNSDLKLVKRRAVYHYTSVGWTEGRDPSQSFSTTFYLMAHPDVRLSGMDPLLHYVLHGKAEGRKVSSSEFREMAERNDTNIDSLLRSLFEEEYYMRCYKPQLNGMDPLTHFIQRGWLLGHDPSPTFSTSSYLGAYDDVRNAGINPLLHYVLHGRAEGRSPQGRINHIVTSSPNQTEDIVTISNEEDNFMETNSTLREVIEALEEHFDRTFYISKYEDIALAKVDPLRHYCLTGWRELRDPSGDFSTNFYLTNNPDVKEAGINPYYHFIIAGRREGRKATAPGGYKGAMLSVLQPLSQLAKDWKRLDAPCNLLDIVSLKKTLLKTRLTKLEAIIISISHDDYKAIPGGVQLCIQREQELAPLHNSAYLHLRPWQALPYIARIEDTDPLVTVTLDGMELGVCPISHIAKALVGLRKHRLETRVVVHHLLGHSIDRIAELVNSVSNGECWFWLHDFFSLCPSFALQRNTISFCNAPPVTSNACSLCIYGEERLTHEVMIKSFFNKVRVHLLSPSKVTADFWKRKQKYRRSSINVVPHMKISWADKVNPINKPGERLVRIAFIGTNVPHKGWNIFTEIVRSQKNKGFYSFHYFGAARAAVDGIEETRVQVTSNNMKRMIEVVAEHQIDFVVHWTSWPETFSFTTYEAIAGGAFVITNEISGNVAAYVKTSGRGRIFKSDADLFDFLKVVRPWN